VNSNFRSGVEEICAILQYYET